MTRNDDHTADEKRHWVRITRRCNNRCVFCLDRETLDGSMVPLDGITADLEKGLAMGARRAVISGGEPTIHPDYLDVIAAARKMGYRWVQTVSNGRMFGYRDFTRRAVEAGLNEITFSLHAHDSDTFEELTGAPGSFRQAIAGLKNALNVPGLVVSVDIVVNRLNVDHLETIVKQFMKLGVHEFDILNLVPFGGAWMNRERLFYDIEEKLPRLSGVFGLSRRPDTNIWTNRFPPYLLEGFEQLIQMPSKFHDEVYGRRQMYEEFLIHGVRPPCEGEQCRYCSMASFCKSLFELKERFQRGEKISYVVMDENVHLLEDIEPDTADRLFLDPPQLIEHELIRPFKKKGIPFTIIFSCVPTGKELQSFRDFNIEIAINSRTAPHLPGTGATGLHGGNVQLACHNRLELETCRKLDISLSAFFDDYAGKQPVRLKAVNVPPCTARADAYHPLDRIPPGIFSPSSGWDLVRHTDFFIQYGYYSQSVRCRPCKFRLSCKGLHINYLRAFGFKEIRGPENGGGRDT